MSPARRPSGRRRIGSGGPWEERIGYSRAVRVGRSVFVSGTTAVQADGTVLAPGDVFGQTQAAYDTIERALHAAGGRLADVVRVRLYLTDIDRWAEAARAHRDRFAAIRPAATMVEVRRLIRPDLLVEIEAEAVISPRRAARGPPRRRRSTRARRAPS